MFVFVCCDALSVICCVQLAVKQIITKGERETKL